METESAEIKRILLLYTDRYYFVKQVYPFGLDVIAGVLRRHGYHVDIGYPFLPEPDVETNLRHLLTFSRPQLVGLGIRNLDTCMSCEPYGDFGNQAYHTFYFLPEIQQIAEALKRAAPNVPIIAGGGAFTVSPEAILRALGIQYGIIGEGEQALLRFLKAYPDQDQVRTIPGLAHFHNRGCVVNEREPYRFEAGTWALSRDKQFAYAFESTGLPVQVKRGCNQQCSYCVEPIIEGREFVFREIEDVIRELEYIAQAHEEVRTLFFVDTEFNLPDLTYCTRLIHGIMEKGLHERFGFTSQFLPKPFGPGFAALLAEAGFSLILTADSFSDPVLKKNQIAYQEKDIIDVLELCDRHRIACTVSMIFGLPGETSDTLDHSLNRMKAYPPDFWRRYEYTVGGRIYEGTPLCRWVEKGGGQPHLYGERSRGYINPYYFCSPEAPLALNTTIERELGYGIAHDNPFADHKSGALALAFRTDQGAYDAAVSAFLNSPLPVCSHSFEYLFRKLTGAGRIREARTICEHLLRALSTSQPDPRYLEQMELVRFYMGLLGP